MAAAVPTSERAVKATSTYPACAIELYASRRLTFDCSSAAKFPMVIDNSAETQTRGSHPAPIGSKAVMKIRRNTAKAAALGPAERNAVTGVGAPWYTSGAHIWNGDADTLKPSPTKISAAATPTNSGEGA